MDDKITLTDNGRVVLKYMQDHDTLLVGADIADATGFNQSVYSTLRSLINKGLVERGKDVLREATTARGNIKIKNFTTYLLTEKGKNHNID